MQIGNGQKRERTQPLPDLEEEVEKTALSVPVLRGSAPIQGGSSSSTDVPVVSSAAVSMSVEDMVQTNVHVLSDVGMPTFQCWCIWITVRQ